MGIFANNKPIGSNDSSIDSIEKDMFEIRQYVNGLSLFIRNCVTPMAVSIQGDWGSGKTSIINMVKEELGDSVIPIWFNTWQYSQFNLGEDLPLSLLGRLIKELKPEQSKSGKINDTFKAAYKAMKQAGRIAASQVIGDEAMKVLDTFASNFVEGKDDVVNAIESLKDDFQECVEYTIERDGKNRVVIFIDDLDRLDPIKAVELLEVLKIFLDCEHCVFVLAIDYSVVSIGVKQKYGELIGSDKGKSFFDKIIQVPFKMPVAHYQVRNYVKEMFRQVDISLRSDKEADIYVDMIQHSVGCNPRTMKRLFNAYLLLMCIGKNVNITAKIEDPTDGPWYRKMMFAILCCQHAYEDLYNFIVWNRADILKADNLQELKNPETYKPVEGLEDADTELDNGIQNSVFHVLQDKFRDASDDLIARMAEFMELFIEVVDVSGDNELDQEKEIKALEELFSISAITMAGDGEEEVENRTARGSRIVSGLEELDMGNLSDAKKTEITEFFQSLGDDVQVLYVEGRYSHIVAKTGPGKGSTFADVYDNKNGYRMDVYAPKNVFTDGRKVKSIVDWVNEHNLNPKETAHPNRISYSITDNKDEEDSLKEFVREVYKSWGKYGKK